MLGLLVLAIILLLAFKARKNIIRTFRVFYHLNKLPGLPRPPFIGITIDLALVQPEGILDIVKEWTLHYEVGKTYILGSGFVGINRPEDLEIALGNVAHITKGMHYDSVREWLGDGLLTSSGFKWHSRRKMLTPTFHFKILEDYIPIMNKCAEILAKKLMATNEMPVDIEKYVSLCTLDVICETAMGVKLEAQAGQAQEYVADIKRICKLIGKKELGILFRSSIYFELSSTGREFRRVLRRLHSFSEKVIANRKYTYKQAAANGDIETKKRKNFLDFLIDYEMKNPGSLTDLDMREEVDTFMFEGHDTTSVAIVYAFLLIGHNQEIQEKIIEELDEIFGDSTRLPTRNDVENMHYLEKVIKEVLRLYPSVPYMARQLTEDIPLKSPGFEGLIIPAGSNIAASPYFLHRKADLYPDPEKFDPERFTDEEIKKRHPFSYFPFSAGPRNCIGQKFAWYELKILISTVLRYNKVESITKREGMRFSPLLILRPSDTVFIRFSPRHK